MQMSSFEKQTPVSVFLCTRASYTCVKGMTALKSECCSLGEPLQYTFGLLGEACVSKTVEWHPPSQVDIHKITCAVE